MPAKEVASIWLADRGVTGGKLAPVKGAPSCARRNLSSNRWIWLRKGSDGEAIEVLVKSPMDVGQCRGK